MDLYLDMLPRELWSIIASYLHPNQLYTFYSLTNKFKVSVDDFRTILILIYPKLNEILKGILQISLCAEDIYFDIIKQLYDVTHDSTYSPAAEFFINNEINYYDTEVSEDINRSIKCLITSSIYKDPFILIKLHILYFFEIRQWVYSSKSITFNFTLHKYLLDVFKIPIYLKIFLLNNRKLIINKLESMIKKYANIDLCDFFTVKALESMKDSLEILS